MSSKLTLRLPVSLVQAQAPQDQTPHDQAPLPATSASRRSSVPIHPHSENNDCDLAGGRLEMKKDLASYKSSSVSKASSTTKSCQGNKKQPQQPHASSTVRFPAMEYLLQTVEDAIYGGAFQGASEHRLLDLVGAAKRELKAKSQLIAQLEKQNGELQGECHRYQSSVSKIQTQSEHLRRSSHGKDAQLQKLVALLHEVHGYEEPELPEDEQQQEQHHKHKQEQGGEEEEYSSIEDEDSSSFGSSDESDDPSLCSSNQTEEDHASDESSLEPAHDEADLDTLQPRNSEELVDECECEGEDGSSLIEESRFAMVSMPTTTSSSSLKHVHEAKILPQSLLSVTVAEPMKKTIREPKPPRGGSGGSSSGSGSGGIASKSSVSKGSRLKFQFPDSELNGLYDDDDDGEDPNGRPNEEYEAKANRLRAAQADPSFSSLTSSPRLSCLQRRRFSSSAVITTTVPLRRKSFTMKRSPAKRIAVTMDNESPSPSAGPTATSDTKVSGPCRWATRRKSMSACYPMRGSASAAGRNSSPAKWRMDQASGSTRDPSSVLASPRSTQMIVRVRERKLDGIPELVIRKKPARFIVWQWNERQVRIPFMIQLGPQQHGIMLRQLRYVKSVMHDFSWAKAHLKDLLSSYTKKDMTKEQLYPQLNYLSHHVQEEIGSKAKKQRVLTAKKHHLTLQLTIAAGVLNDMRMVKFGRRGKPHDTKLCYDPSDPTRLYWLRKNGEKSDEFLPVDEIDVRGNNAQFDTMVIKRAARKYPLDPECCVSLVTGVRNLDLQLKSTLQRDWLLSALHDIISFVRQYKAAGVMGRRQQSHKDLQSLTVLGRR